MQKSALLIRMAQRQDQADCVSVTGTAPKIQLPVDVILNTAKPLVAVRNALAAASCYLYKATVGKHQAYAQLLQPCPHLWPCTVTETHRKDLSCQVRFCLFHLQSKPFYFA